MAQFPSTTSASGIWTLKKQKRGQQGANWPGMSVPVDYLVIAGGGAGGGTGLTERGAGGGAGGYRSGSSFQSLMG